MGAQFHFHGTVTNVAENITNNIVNNNIVNNTNNITNHHAVLETDGEMRQITDGHVCRAILAINGKDRPLREFQLWAGVCCMLGWKYGYPRDMKECCERINTLPLGELEYPCNYESVRKMPLYRFIHEDARTWDSYKPRKDEERLFNKCLTVAQAFDKEMQRQISDL